jgi:hypothetical protein
MVGEQQGYKVKVTWEYREKIENVVKQKMIDLLIQIDQILIPMIQEK